MFKVLRRNAPQWMGEEYSEMLPPQKVCLAIVDSNTLNHQYCTVSRSRRMVEARRGAIDQKANEFELDAKFRARHEYTSQQDLCRQIGGDACKSNVQKGTNSWYPSKKVARIWVQIPIQIRTWTSELVVDWNNPRWIQGSSNPNLYRTTGACIRTRKFSMEALLNNSWFVVVQRNS